jgi:hypothetical protein
VFEYLIKDELVFIMAGTIHCDNTRNRTSSELELILKIGGIEPGTGGFLKSNFGEG